jgi:cobaltochelatase CobS
MTTTEVASLKRTELQQAACRQFGKSAASWTGRATNEELRQALTEGEPPARVANGNGHQPDLAAAIASAIQPMLQTQLDEARVQEIVTEQITSALADVEIRLAEVATQRGPKELRVVLPDGTKTDVGQQHTLFADLLHYVAAGENVFAVGPAGSGKTTAAKNVATALGLPFCPKSMGPATDEFSLLGYRNAVGDYVPGLLREPFEHGGLVLLDEMDRAHPAVLTTLNAMLDNGFCQFPDRLVEQHHNFRLIASGNTFGRGANAVYVGACQLDASTLNRFIVLDWHYDHDLELAVVTSAYGSGAELWVTYVQRCRAAADRLAVRVVISPRQSLKGAKHLALGRSWEEVEARVLWGGIAATDRDQILRNL